MATKKEIKEHLEIALKEIGVIKPWYDREVDEWVFSHPDYPVEYGGETSQEVIKNYPKYLAEFIKHRLNDNLNPLTEKKTKGHGGERKRCFGSAPGKEFYAEYHDKEWGIPVYDDRHLFEMLILEGAQAGLSWETILKRREEYRKVFHHFNPQKVAKMTDEELDTILDNQGIIRNRLKIYAARQNARVFLQIQKEFRSFSEYLWNFVEGKPIVTRRKSLKEIPASTTISEALSKDLKKRGMTFVGPTIMYAFMQAVGLVDDHLADCWCVS